MANYYTLAKLGIASLEPDGPMPDKYGNVLAGLQELLLENDVPRTPEQVSHAANVDAVTARRGLGYLISKGYVKKGTPPQPAKKGQTSKIRIRPIEELAAAEARAEISRKKYASSMKGQIAHQRYEDSIKGKDKNKKYWEDPNKGRLVQKKYRLRKRITEMEAHLKLHPELADIIVPDLEQSRKRLAELEK